MTRARGSSRNATFFGISAALVGLLLLLGVLAFAPVASEPAGWAAFGSAAVDYPVVFNQSGLPNGTTWSISLNSTTETSNHVSIEFTEPNGAYQFWVGSVPGYTASPELNITVAAAPVEFTVVFTNTSGTTGPPPTNSTLPTRCTSFSWASANNTLGGNCLGMFSADYHAFSPTVGSTLDNSTFVIGPFAEVAPSGTVVALAVPGFEGFGSLSVVSTPTEINVTDLIVGNVTNAIGVNNSNGAPNGATPVWSPVDLPASGGATTWGSGTNVLGNTTISIVFHFANNSADGTSRVRFDVSIDGWPWVSASDELALAVQSTAFSLPNATHFIYTASDDTISAVSDATGEAVTSLAFDSTANATGPHGTETLTVSDQVGLFPSGADPSAAGALLTFSGAGGYSALTYDPYVVFGPQEVPSSPVGGSPSSLLPPAPVLAALGGVVGAGIVLAGVARRVRRAPIEEGLRPAV